MFYVTSKLPLREACNQYQYYEDIFVAQIKKKFHSFLFCLVETFIWRHDKRQVICDQFTKLQWIKVLHLNTEIRRITLQWQ